MTQVELVSKIRKNLTSVGWDKLLLNKVFVKTIYSKKEDKALIHLQSFYNKQKGFGKTDAELMHKLLTKGWNKELILKVILKERKDPPKKSKLKTRS